jgi:hypothetical protein
VINRIAAQVPTASLVKVYTEDNDPNRLLGRPTNVPASPEPSALRCWPSVLRLALYALVFRTGHVNIMYVDVTAEFAGHCIDSGDDTFINPLGTEAAFHPNADGYGAYADAISASLPRG